MNKLNRTNCSRHDTATTPSLIIKYLDNGGQDGGQLSGHALDQRGRDAVEAEGGHLSVGCEESGGRVKREEGVMIMTRSTVEGDKEESRQGTNIYMQ